MTKGLFTSLEEIKFQRDLWRRAHRPIIKREEKFKPLFTSVEEFKFQVAFVNGNVVPVRRESNAGRNPIQTRRLICSKGQTKKIQQTFKGRTR